MSRENRFHLGDVDPERFEEDKQLLLPPDELVIGSSYTMRYRMPPVGQMEYIADYPVQVADIRQRDDGTWLELVFIKPRDPSWSVSPMAIPLSEQGFIEIDNTGPNKIKDWGEGTVIAGYLLPYAANT